MLQVGVALLNKEMGMARVKPDEVRIEYPSRGETYCEDGYGVYAYGEYEPWSVLAGRERRRFLGFYPSEAEARSDHPDAIPGLNGCGFQQMDLSCLPGEDDPETDEEYFSREDWY